MDLDLDLDQLGSKIGRTAGEVPLTRGLTGGLADNRQMSAQLSQHSMSEPAMQLQALLDQHDEADLHAYLRSMRDAKEQLRKKDQQLKDVTHKLETLTTKVNTDTQTLRTAERAGIRGVLVNEAKTAAECLEIAEEERAACLGRDAACREELRLHDHPQNRSDQTDVQFLTEQARVHGRPRAAPEK